MTDIHQQIADLENEIDALAEAAERCRKIMLVAQAAIAAGPLLFGATVFGLASLGAPGLLGGITALLAGLALYGSHRSTLQELGDTIAARDAQRCVLIDAIELTAIREA